MKVPEQKPNPATVPPAASKEKMQAPTKQKAFSAKMQKKKMTLESLPLQSAALNQPATAQQFQKLGLGAVATTSEAELPAPIQGLAHEIHVHVDSSGNTQVRIQFDSNVFDGLQVQISKVQDGAVAITFTTSNQDTSQLLSKNLSALSSALASKGVPVSTIQFETTSSSSDGDQSFNSNQGSDRGYDGTGKQRKHR